MSRFSDGNGRICKTEFCSFEQILNLYFHMTIMYCTSNISCLTFVTTAINFFVTVGFKVLIFYGMMTYDLIWTDAP